MGDNEQKLTIRADAEGFEDAAKKVAKVTEAQADLEKQIGEVNEAVRETVQVDRRRDNDGLAQRTKEHVTGFAKLTLAIWSTVKVMKWFGAAGATLAAGRAILNTLREEIRLRERLVEIMGLQSEAADEIKNKQLAQKAALEDIADRRLEGGFSADVARTVQSGAESAKKQFTQLKEENINLAFGNFGDIPGISQQELVNLAILAQVGRLEVSPEQSQASRKRQNDRLQRRYAGLFDDFARRETVQGQGTGKGEFRPKVTEREQEAFAEGRSKDGALVTLKARLKELLPADFGKTLEGEEKSRVDLAADLYRLLGGAKGFEEATVGVFTDLRPLTTLINKLRGVVEIGLPDQKGFGAQFQEMLGLTEEFVTMGTREYGETLKALRTIDREAGLKAGSAADNMNRSADAMERFAEAAERGADRPNVYNYQNAKFVGPDADTRRGRTRNGRTLVRSREGV